MEAVKPRFGQADKSSSKLTSRTWGLHSAGQLRSKGQAGSWSWGRTPWSSPGPSGLEAVPPLSGTGPAWGTTPPAQTASTEPQLGWQGGGMSSAWQGDRHGPEGSTFRQPEADSARPLLLEAGRRARVDGRLRNGADTTAGSRWGRQHCPRRKPLRPLTTGHAHPPRGASVLHDTRCHTWSPSHHAAPWTSTRYPKPHASQQSRRTRWGDGPLQRGPGSEVLSDGKPEPEPGPPHPKSACSSGALAASSLPVSTLELLGSCSGRSHQAQSAAQAAANSRLSLFFGELGSPTREAIHPRNRKANQS